MSAWGRPSDARAPPPAGRGGRRGRGCSCSRSAFLQTPPGQRALASALSSAASTGNAASTRWHHGLLPDRSSPGADRARRPQRAVAHGRRRAPAAGRSRRCCRAACSIENLSAARIDVLRAPEPDKGRATPADGGSLRLPVGIDLQALSVDDLHLAAALARRRFALATGGQRASCRPICAEGRLRLTGDRTDGRTGHLTADIRFDAGRRTVDGEIALDEGQGGVVAALLERPELDRVGLRLAARAMHARAAPNSALSAGDAATASGTRDMATARRSHDGLRPARSRRSRPAARTACRRRARADLARRRGDGRRGSRDPDRGQAYRGPARHRGLGALRPRGRPARGQGHAGRRRAGRLRRAAGRRRLARPAPAGNGRSARAGEPARGHVLLEGGAEDVALGGARSAPAAARQGRTRLAARAARRRRSWSSRSTSARRSRR